MSTESRTRIIIPCYNEALRLQPQAFLDALHTHRYLSFLFVNDGSTDGTLSILQRMKKMNPGQIGVLNLEKNAGKAEAVRRGMADAIQAAFDYVGYWDADLATRLEVIDTFCGILDSGEADMVIGSRVRLLGRNIERKALRHYLGRIFATFASLLLNIPVYDTQCGAKIFRNTPALARVFGRPFKVKWTFDVELLARLTILQDGSPADVRSGWVEYPLESWVDVGGSKIKLIDFFKGGIEYCRLFFYLKSPARSWYHRYLTD